MCTTPTTPNATNGDGETIAEVQAQGRQGSFVADLDRQLDTLGRRRVDEWWAPGYEPGQIGFEQGPYEIDCYVERAAWQPTTSKG